MNVADLKAAGDLARKRDDLNGKLDGYRLNRRRSVIDAAKTEFGTYFEKQGFTISDRGNERVAQYEGATVTLLLPDPGVETAGAFAKFSVVEEIGGGRKSEHSIVANLKLPPREVGLSRDQKTDVEKLQEHVRDLEKILKAFPSVTTEYHFLERSGTARIRAGQQALESFTASLKELFP